MNPPLPVVTGKRAIGVAIKSGFRLDRQKGSHAVLVRDSDRRRVVIPMHVGKALKPKTLAGIMAGHGALLLMSFVGCSSAWQGVIEISRCARVSRPRTKWTVK